MCRSEPSTRVGRGVGRGAYDDERHPRFTRKRTWQSRADAHIVRGRHGSCSCASQTSSGASARTRSWPSVCGSSRAPEQTAPSPPPTTGRPPAAPAPPGPPASLDDDHLHAACVARRRDESEPGKQLELAVDRHVAHAGCVDPLANGVVVLAVRVVELATLDVDRPAGEKVVAAAVVEVQVCVDDDVDAREVEVLLAQWTEAGVEVDHRGVQLRHAGVDQHARIRMVDDVHVDRHPLALGEQVGNADWRDGDWGGGVHGGFAGVNPRYSSEQPCRGGRQVAKTALPAASTPTSGWYASSPGSEIVWRALSAPVNSVRSP